MDGKIMRLYLVLRNALTIVAILYAVSQVYITTPVRAITVFDPSNFTQNTLTAIRNFEQINNQIRSLQNQVEQLISMRQNLIALPNSLVNEVVTPLRNLQNLVNRANALAFNIEASTEMFKQKYPNEFAELINTKGGLLKNELERWGQLKSSYETTLGVQSETISLVERDGERLAQIMSRSSGATGNLAVSQAGNELKALNVSTMLKLLTVITTNQRTETLRNLKKEQGSRESHEDLKHFFRRK